MGNKRILLVDDNPSDRLIVKTLAEKKEFLVIEAADGFAAISALDEEPFSLMVIDLQMPKFPGLELVKRIRRIETHKKTPILIMSGRNRPVDIQSAIQTGASDYLIKPMDLQVLEEKLMRLTAGQNESWKSYNIPVDQQMAQGHMLMSVLSINELGAEIRMNFEVPIDQSFPLHLDLLAQKGLPLLLVKVESMRRDASGFIYKTRFIGLSEPDRKKIRLSCREINFQETA